MGVLFAFDSRGFPYQLILSIPDTLLLAVWFGNAMEEALLDLDEMAN
jgi:hypothetical protein